MAQSNARRTRIAGLTGLMLGLIAGVALAQTPTGQNAPGAATAPPSLSSPSDKVVLKVGDQQITQADLDFVVSSLNAQAQQALASQGRRPIGEQYAMIVLLAQQAVSHHLDASPTFLRQVAMQRRQLLSQAAYQELLSQATVSPAEIDQYFSAHQNEYEEAQVREIVIRKRQLGAKENNAGLTAEDARARADEIRKALVDGTPAKKVADQFQVANQIMIDAEPRNIRRGAVRPEMEKVAFALKDGEVSEVFDLPQALVFFQVAGHRQPEAKEVSQLIQDLLRQKKVDAALADLKKNTPIWMDEQYFAPRLAGPTVTPSAQPSAAPPSSTPPAQR